ncbi:Cna B-type domain-containing protein [Propionimicrobium lymphophilum]|uniref:Cna B-type domain-containing protein n=1 Tax=Propionimicrobium lymphophilum TaxID=33012 RepID=UPI0004299EF7|nr:Cna B-type domain-containing protein [Propionimicrobium lymphophilum]
MHKKLFGAIGAIVLVLFTIIGPAGVVSADAATPWDEIVAKAQASGEVEAAIDGDVTLAPDSPQLVVKAGSTLTLTGGGTVVGAGKPAIKVEKGAKLNLNGPSFTKAQFLVDGEMNFTAGAIKDTAVRGPVIFVNGGTLTIDGTAEFSGNDVSGTEGEISPEGIENEKYAPITAYGGTVNVKGGVIVSNKGVLKGGAIGLWGNADNLAKLNISGGEISKNHAEHPTKNAFGGAVFAENAAISITGGKISENSTEYGGGLMQIGGTFKMSDGVFSKNSNGEYNGRGGGLLLDGVSTEISGGKFTENTANGFGGGLVIHGGEATIKGGVLEGNTALKSGGGVAFLGDAKATIEALNVTGNFAKGFWGGGGIYNDDKSTLTMLNTVVSGNQIADKTFLIGAGDHPVSKQGGGLWDCPHGSTVFNITNGVAIFDNKAPNAGEDKSYLGAGDDFLSVTTHFSGTPKEGHPVKISERMLGGGERFWYQDGSAYGVHGNWSAENQLPRYITGGDNKRVPFNEEINENKAFKSVPSIDAKGLANKIATVHIANNTVGNDVSFSSARAGLGISGGGITNNGKLIFGTADTWKLKIKKAWDSDDPNTRPEEIDVDVLVGKFKVDQVHLSKDNGWTAEVLNFPNPATLIDASTGEKLPITFRESGADGYDLAVVEEGDDQAKVYTFNLTNRKLVEVPVEKAWDDFDNKHQLRPESIDVELVVDGKASGQKLTLNGDNSWKGKFEKLPKYKDGKELDYSVREVSVESYESKVSGDAKHGFVITNKVIEPTPTPTPTPTTPPTSKKPKLPRTGNAGEMFAITAIGLAAAAAIVLRRRGR